MSPEQIELVQDDFAQVHCAPVQAADLFGTKLLKLDPSSRPMFRADVRAQGAELMATLALVVCSRNNLEPLLGALDSLAARHRGYSVVRHHSGLVGQSLI